jgi:hypothetical protein
MKLPLPDVPTLFLPDGTTHEAKELAVFVEERTSPVFTENVREQTRAAVQYQLLDTADRTELVIASKVTVEVDAFTEAEETTVYAVAKAWVLPRAAFEWSAPAAS